MRLFALIGLIGIVGGRSTAWLLKRRRPRLADAFRLGTMIFTQAVVAVIFTAIAVQLAQDDDTLRRALALLVGLLALTTAMIGGVYAWAWRKHGASGEKS
jgi:protein-S-isoprenylcysteine O-methyltransferase Ste14